LEIDIPADIKNFLDEVVNSFTMWDLLIFFSKKNTELSSPAYIARRLGRPLDEVKIPIQRLEKLGLVVLDKLLDGELNCRINEQSSLVSFLNKFAEYNERQESRLKILSYLLQKKIH
jgi:hypothetical protein